MLRVDGGLSVVHRDHQLAKAEPYLVGKVRIEC